MPRALMMENVLVRFTRSMTPYMAGERAGFPPAKAKSICDKGYAVPVAPTGAEAEKPDQKAPAESSTKTGSRKPSQRPTTGSWAGQ